MEDKIFDIVTDLLREDITKTEAIDKLLILHSVSKRACDFYIAGSNTGMNCNNCGEPHFMHGC